MANPRTIKITELPASTQDLNETDRLVAVQPFGSALLTVQLPASKILDAARTAGAGAASSSGLVFATVADAQSSHLLPGKSNGTALSTTGYAAIGDGGAATYEKVATEPSHAGKFQDTVGAWWELKVGVVRPEMFGAVADGVTDDTAAIQAAMEFVGVKQSVVFRDRIYAITSLEIPALKSICFDTEGGRATLLGLNATDNRALVASGTWTKNLAYGSQPFRANRIIFDGANLKDYGFAICSYDSWLTECEFRGCNIGGLYPTHITEDGTETGIQIGGLRIINCYLKDNVGSGFLNTSNHKDFHVAGNRANGNGRYGFEFESVAGLQMSRNNIFGNTLGTAIFKKLGFGTIITDTIFDGETFFDSLGSDNNAVLIGPGNTFMDDAVYCNMVSNQSPVTFTFEGNHFQGEAHILHAYNGASRTVRVIGGTSESSQPFRWETSAAQPAGQIWTSNHFNKYHGAMYNGYIYRVNNAWVNSIAPNSVYLDKKLDSASSTTTLLSFSVPANSAAGSIIRGKISAISVENSSTIFAGYTSEFVVAYIRKQNSSVAYTKLTILNEIGPENMGIDLTSSVVGTTGTHDVTVTIRLNHAVPSDTAATRLLIEVHGQHRLSTRMALV